MTTTSPEGAFTVVERVLESGLCSGLAILALICMALLIWMFYLKHVKPLRNGRKKTGGDQ